jgi:replicative superfamily II helicase
MEFLPTPCTPSTPLERLKARGIKVAGVVNSMANVVTRTTKIKTFKYYTCIIRNVYWPRRKIMHSLSPSTAPRTSTTDMEVTSIRFERELKEKLKELAGSQGYQSLVRDILWEYVQQRSEDYRPNITTSDIRISIAATAQREERCAITGKAIQSHENMQLGLTTDGKLVPLSADSLGS